MFFTTIVLKTMQKFAFETIFIYFIKNRGAYEE